MVDPVNGVEGVFCWRNGRAKLFPHFWVGDEIHLSSQGKERQPSSAPPPDMSPASSSARQEAPQPITMLTLLLAVACTLLLGYLLGGMKSSAEHLRSEIGAVAQYGLFKGLKPGMHEKLDGVQNNLQVIGQAVNQLSQDHIKLAGDAGEEKKKQWILVLQAIIDTLRDVQRINADYSLTPEEAAKVQELINDKEAETANVSVPCPAQRRNQAAAARRSLAGKRLPGGRAGNGLQNLVPRNRAGKVNI